MSDRINPYVKFDVEYLKENIPIERVMAEYAGVQTDGRRGKAVKCPAPDHPDKRPSAQIYHDNNICKCFACGSAFNPVSLAKAYNPNMNFTDLCYKLAEDFGIPLEVCSDIRDREQAQKEHRPIFSESFPLKYSELEEIGLLPADNEAPKGQQRNIMPYVIQMKQNINKTNYHRGLSQETLERFNVGFSESWNNPISKNDFGNGYPRIIIPTSEHSYLARLAVPVEDKDLESRLKCRKVGETKLFNADALKGDKPIFIVEGEIDAMSICDVGGEAVGIGGTGNVPHLIELLSQERPSQPFIISMDNVKAGTKAKQALIEGFDNLGITYIVADVTAPYKDANEALNNDREGFAKQVKEASAYASRLKGREKLIPEKVKQAMDDITPVMPKQEAGAISVQQMWREADKNGKADVEALLIEKIDEIMSQYQKIDSACRAEHEALIDKYTPEEWQKNLNLYEKYNEFVKNSPTTLLRLKPEQIQAVKDAASLTWSENIGMAACEKVQHFMDMKSKVVEQQNARERFYKAQTQKKQFGR